MNRPSPPRIDAGKASSSGTGDSTATGETSSGRVGASARNSRRTAAASPIGQMATVVATVGPSREELELELRHDPEVAAAAAQAPEQVGMLVGARADDRGRPR